MYAFDAVVSDMFTFSLCIEIMGCLVLSKKISNIKNSVSYAHFFTFFYGVVAFVCWTKTYVATNVFSAKKKKYKKLAVKNETNISRFSNEIHFKEQKCQEMITSFVTIYSLVTKQLWTIVNSILNITVKSRLRKVVKFW